MITDEMSAAGVDETTVLKTREEMVAELGEEAVQKIENEAASVDLDKLREEKIGPLAEACLIDLADLMFPEEVDGKRNLDEAVLAILKKSRDADLNLTTETSHLFKTMLKSLTFLGDAIQKAEIAEVKEDEYNRVAKEIFSILKDSTCTEEDAIAVVERTFNERGYTRLEAAYIRELIFTVFSSVNTSYSSSIEKSMERAEEKLFGCGMSEISMKKLDDVLNS